VQGLHELLKPLGAARLAAMAALTVALTGFFGFLILPRDGTPVTTLFTEVSYEAARWCWSGTSSA
jgi:flagellar M-ring protein FliF